MNSIRYTSDDGLGPVSYRSRASQLHLHNESQCAHGIRGPSIFAALTSLRVRVRSKKKKNNNKKRILYDVI